MAFSSLLAEERIGADGKKRYKRPARDLSRNADFKVDTIVDAPKKYELSHFNIDTDFDTDKLGSIWIRSVHDAGLETSDKEIEEFITAARESRIVMQYAIFLLNQIHNLSQKMEDLQKFLKNIDNESSAWNKNAISYTKEIEQKFKNKIIDSCKLVCSSMGMNSLK